MYPPESDPLREATKIAALAALARHPAPGSHFEAATRATTTQVHIFPEEKLLFDALQRALSVSLSRRVSQPETLRWVLGLAASRREELLRSARMA